MNRVTEDGLRPVDDLRIAIDERGKGRPFLFLHPGIGLWQADEVLSGLARLGRVLAPSHPGFGKSPRPDRIDRIDDLAFFYRRLLEVFDLRDVVLVGAGLGGWIAAAIAVLGSERLSALVLAGAVGIRVNDRDAPDLADLYVLPRADVDRMTFADPARARRNPADLSEEEALEIARNREAAALYGWTPYLHDPKLKARLRYIDLPALVLWGEADELAPVAYGRAYAEAIPGARFETIPGAGHFPHIEQPGAFVDRIGNFLDGLNDTAGMRRRG